MPNASQESRIILVIEAIQLNPQLSIRHAATLYDIPKVTLHARMNGRTSKANSRNARLNLINTEEEAIKRGSRPVGKRWTERFIKRRPELKTRFSRVYDY
ncbi:transposase [Colletotrichum chrysophilum]|uniref:Transposase n=1 Tax=Colletotrichum chrysophilum TaxID=1836956 RepID=A0AAD9ATN8_9PEZI|nr:transposase [Colletotrichum chrysophilum]